MTTATAPLSCVCLTPRRRTAGGYLVCPNCDMVQEQETRSINGQPGRRRITTEDRRFHLAWEERKRAIYGTA